MISSTTKKIPFKSSGIRRSARSSKKRDYYLTEFRIGRKLFYKTDNERGLNQPGGKIWSQKELNQMKKSHKGKQLFQQYLTEAKWKWKNSKLGEYGYVCVAPNIPKAGLVKNVNYFMSYVDIYDQYCKDGSIIEQILKRGSKFAACGNLTKHATSTDDLPQTATIHGMKLSEAEVNNQRVDLSSKILNGDNQNEILQNESGNQSLKHLATISLPSDHEQDTGINKEFFIHHITPHASPTDHGEEGTDAVYSIDLHAVAPDEVIIPRLERIEYTLGVPKSRFLHSKVYQRLTMLEEDCGVEMLASLSTTAKTSFLRRVELLEGVIGI